MDAEAYFAAYYAGHEFAGDCIMETHYGPGSRDREGALAPARKHRGCDHALTFALDELERLADACRLGTVAALLHFVDELEQDVPIVSNARALLLGLRSGASLYGEVYER